MTWDVVQLMRRTEGKTTSDTRTRRGAALVNTLAQQILFEGRKQQALGAAMYDWYNNMANFDEKEGTGMQGKPPAGMRANMSKGMRVFLTNNLSTRDDFANGMQAEVEAYDPASGELTVLTSTKKRLGIFRHT